MARFLPGDIFSRANGPYITEAGDLCALRLAAKNTREQAYILRPIRFLFRLIPWELIRRCGYPLLSCGPKKRLNNVQAERERQLRISVQSEKINRKH